MAVSSGSSLQPWEVVRGARTKDAASMIPSSTGCEQSIVNLRVCFLLAIFFLAGGLRGNRGT